MPHKLPVVSGAEIVRFFVRQGSLVKRQCARHVVVQNGWRVFSVPLHHELKKGTLIGILKQAGISVEEFREIYR